MQDSFHRLLHKADGERAEWEYPFAVAGVNISFMLVQMLDLQSGEVNAQEAKCSQSSFKFTSTQLLVESGS